jgi:tetratricopeptide (TPR) repeat protein
MKRISSAVAGVLLAGALAVGNAEGPSQAYLDGLKLAKEQRYKGALEAFRSALRERPDQPGLYYNMGNVLRHMGEHAEAVKAYREAVAQDPGDADAYYNMAMTYSVMDEMDLALAALEEVVRIRPDDGEAHYRLAMGHYTRRKLELARRHFGLAKKAGYPVPQALEEACSNPAPSRGQKKGSP